MKTIKLEYPIVVDGKSVDALTVHRPKARDMIAIGDHMPKIAALKGGTEEELAERMNSDLFRAMVAFVGALAGIGEEAALELDFGDLVNVVSEAAEVMGEPKQSTGKEKTGG